MSFGGIQFSPQVALTWPLLSAVKVVAAQSCLILPPRGLQPARLLCPRDFPGKNTGVGWDLPDPEIEPGSPALQADSLSSKPPGKPFNLPRSSQLPGVMGTSIVIHDYYCPILLTGRLTHGGVK